MKVDGNWYVRPKEKDFPSGISYGGVVVCLHNGSLLVALLGISNFTSCALSKGEAEKGESVLRVATREISEETDISRPKSVVRLGV